jgi:hypothetical protein
MYMSAIEESVYVEVPDKQIVLVARFYELKM